MARLNAGRRYEPSYGWARLEHAWLLKAEGLRLEDIGRRFGVTRERARQMIVKFGRRMERATMHARWRIEP
jgi:DNA-directed RNA polymerase sigma subunit (sigma70/sigma32)